MGKKFVPRLTAPSVSDKYWISSAKGGLNICLLISGNSVLPNCVGYVWGRFYELLGEKPKLSSINAEDFYGNTGDGYKRSTVPKLGAIACWRKGLAGNPNDGYGHVAVVEKIEANGDILTSNSAYGGLRFYTATYKKNNGYNSGLLTFQGFILPPVLFGDDVFIHGSTINIGDVIDFTGGNVYGSSSAVNPTNSIKKVRKVKITNITPNAKHPYHAVSQDGSGVYGWIDADCIGKSVDEIACEVILGKWGNGNERKQQLEAAGYDYKEIQAKVNALLM